jgi:amino acid adenylation domain-containing protein
MRMRWTAMLSAAKQTLLQQRLEGRARETTSIARRRRGAQVPLSFAQRRLWFLEQYHPGSSAYIVPAVFQLRGALDRAVLERAMVEVVSRHEILRTTFGTREGMPIQLIAAEADVTMPLLDLSELEPDERERRFREAVAAERQPPFELDKGPLMRTCLFCMGADEHRLFVNLHHIVIDGWGLGVLMRELAACYRAELAAEGAALEPVSLQYGDFAVWEQENVTDEIHDADMRYWREQLADLAPLELPTDRPRARIWSPRGARQTFVLGRETRDAIAALATATQTTPFMVLLAVFQALLHRYTGQDDVSVGTPVAGRTKVELERLVGCLTNTLVLRTQMAGDPSFRELLGRVRTVTLDAYEHQATPFEWLVDELQPARDPSRHPLFQVAFALQNVPPLTAVELGGTVMSMMEMVGEVTKFDLATTFVEDDGDLRGEVEYSTELFDRSTVDRFIAHYRVALAAALVDPDVRLSRLPLLPDSEHAIVVVTNNYTDVDGDCTPPHELCARRARDSPQVVAIDCGEQRMTYAELERRAELLAARLRALGATRESVVGICIERSPALVVGAVATLKAGAAYLPLDPSYPSDRLAFMLRDSGVRILLSTHDLRGRVSSQDLHLICVDEIESPSTPAGASDAAHETPVASIAAAQTPAGQLAYVIYTSGSSGRPKGTEIEHGGLANLVHWHLRAYGLGPSDRTTLIASPGFDASVWELWPTLAAGATLCIPPPEIRADPAELARWLARERITVSFLPTALAEAVMDEPDLAESSLRYLLTGGDALARPPRSATHFSLVNHYGPTENTVVTTAGVVAPAGERARRPPIGRPIDNVRVYVLDAAGEPVPIGVPGELFVGGAGVARGYVKRPEPDSARFAEDTDSARFTADRLGPIVGGRLYRTGDRARWLPDGQLEFLGRADAQTKIRGFRIEPAEIEAVLCEHPAIRDAVVVLRRGASTEQALVALVVLDGSAPTGAELRRLIRERLPSYMVPAAFERIARVPLTGHGKVDRRAAASERGVALAAEAPAAPARTETERVVASIWRELLELDEIGVEDNFFDRGGHSLLAIELQRRLARRFARDVPVLAVFEHPTVIALASYLDAGVRVEGELSGEHAARRLAALRRRPPRAAAPAPVGGEGA